MAYLTSVIAQGWSYQIGLFSSGFSIVGSPVTGLIGPEIIATISQENCLIKEYVYSWHLSDDQNFRQLVDYLR